MHVHVLWQSQCCRDTPFSSAIDVVERLSCLERKVCGLQHEQLSQSAAVQDIQSGHDSLLDYQRMDRVETQPRGRSSRS